MLPHDGSKLPPVALIATVIGATVYASAVYWSSRHPSGLTLALASLPFVWFSAAYAKGAWRSDVPPLARIGRLAPFLLVVLTLVLAWNTLLTNVRLLYLAQHVGVHAALCWLFGRTLLAGHTPLCTEFASWVHVDMTSSRLLWYTRQVTKAWALFFGLMTLASIALFSLAPAATWTTFSTIGGPILTGAMFLIENLLRNHYLPPHDRVGLAGTWRAVRARLQDRAQSPQRAP